VSHTALKYSFNDLRNGILNEVSKGTVNQTINEDGLELYSYSKVCPFDKSNWNDFTRVSRGIILDPKQEKIINLPFEKFFNYGEETTEIPELKYSIYEKMDGSLVCLWNFNGIWKVSTKGSFHSDQAKWSEHFLHNVCKWEFSALQTNLCYCFEAIYKDNRIVIPYEEEGLFLLAVFNRDTGEELFNIEEISQKIGCRAAEKKDYSSIAELVEKTKTLPQTEEGWVLRFENSYRVKIKGEAYLRLHRAISNLTPLTIWGLMKNGDDLASYKKELPEEFWGDFDKIVYLLNLRLDELLKSIKKEHEKWKGFSNKELGLSLNLVDCRVIPYLFNYRNGKDLFSGKLRVSLYNDIKPSGNKLDGYVPCSFTQGVINNTE
jgi:RNA ligase